MIRAQNKNEIAISDHAVQRLRERTGAEHMPSESLREALREMIQLQRRYEEQHYAPGQTRILVDFFGVTVYAVMGEDETGWTRGGRAVVTILTPEQVHAGVER